MESIKQFGETAKGLARNPLGIIALFIVLIYGFASLVVGVSGNLEPPERLPIIWFLVVFPVIVLAVFAWLVSRHHEKLYAPKDYTNDKSFLDAASNKNNVREDIDDLDRQIESRIHQAVTSEEFIGKLSKSNGHFEDVLNDIASTASKEVIDSAFVEIDAREFTGDKEKIFSFPVSAFSNLNNLTDKVYFKLKSQVKAYAYGFSWVLVDASTKDVIRNARMITNAGQGTRVEDNRSLADVGIKGGTKLVVSSPENT